MGLYRAILTLAAPVLLAAALWRVLGGRETLADLRQRLGLDAPGCEGAIWLHGASNGELASARPMIDALIARFPGRPLVITSNTVSGRALAQGWDLPQTAARLAPFDFRRSLAAFRRACRPAVLILLENELWPNRIGTAQEPVLIAGARMSASSHRLWSRFPRLARRLLSKPRRVWPQDAASADRFRALGLPENRLGPTATLKSAVSIANPPKEQLERLSPCFPRADTALAASTHDGEERIVLEGFAAARRARPGLKLILAPRHPARGPEIARMIEATGLAWAQRSRGGAPGADTAIYLADTLGEMPLWYALAGVTFVGGSLVPKGGHTPFEPAQARSAILHGPHVANFTEAYAALSEADGARVVRTAQQLADALTSLKDGNAQSAMAARAAAALRPLKRGQVVIDDVVAVLQGILGSDPGDKPPGQV